MDVSAPWLTGLVGTLAGIIVTQGLNMLAERARRRDERATRLDPEKTRYYLDYMRACDVLLGLPVWAAGRPEPTAPAISAIRQAGTYFAFAAPASVARAARQATEAAGALAAEIDRVRDTTLRPSEGRPAEDCRQHRERLMTALDAFALAGRRDVGVTADYLPLAPN